MKQNRSTPSVNARDLERINAAADRLNAEALDVLQYQKMTKTNGDRKHCTVERDSE